MSADINHPPVTVSEFTEKMALLRSALDEGLEDEYHVSWHVTIVLRCYLKTILNDKSMILFSNIASMELPLVPLTYLAVVFSRSSLVIYLCIVSTSMYQ